MNSKKNVGIQTDLETKEIGIQTDLENKLNEKIKLDDIENIIFPGGFMKGYAYIGFIKYLKETLGNEKIKNIKNIIGVSIGSVFSLGLILECDLKEIMSFLFKYKLNTVDCFDIESCLNFKNNYGIDNGIKVNTFIKNFLSEKVGNPYITFKQLYALTTINYVVVGCNLSLKKTEYFSHTTTPDMMIWLAIRISCNLPFLFNSVKLNNYYYLDGGITNNYPIDYIQNDLKENLNKTLIIKFKTKKNIYNNNSFTEFLQFLLNSLKHQDSIRIEKYHHNTLKLNMYINSYEEHITDDTINEVIEQGYNDTKDFFEN